MPLSFPNEETARHIESLAYINEQTKHRAARSLRAAQTPILTAEQARRLPDIGEILANEINIFCANRPGLPPNPAAAAARAALLRASTPSLSYPIPPANNDRPTASTTSPTRWRIQAASGAVVMSDDEHAEFTPTPTHPTPSRGRGSTGRPGERRRGTARGRRTPAPPRDPGTPSNYRPKLGTGAHAILIALHRELTTSNTTALSKQELIDLAQPYSDEPMTKNATSDPRTWYAGWNGCTTLKNHSYILAYGRPTLHQLTELGKIRAADCYQEFLRARGAMVSAYGEGQVSRTGADAGMQGEARLADLYSPMKVGSGASPRGGRGRGRGRARGRRRGPGCAGSSTASPVRSGVPSPTRGTGSPSGGKRRQVAAEKGEKGRGLSDTQVERAARVVARLEKSYSRDRCLHALGVLFEDGRFPRSDDALYNLLSDRLWTGNSRVIQGSRRGISIAGFGDGAGGSRRGVGNAYDLALAEGREFGEVRIGNAGVGPSRVVDGGGASWGGGRKRPRDSCDGDEVGLGKGGDVLQARLGGHVRSRDVICIDDESDSDDDMGCGHRSSGSNAQGRKIEMTASDDVIDLIDLAEGAEDCIRDQEPLQRIPERRTGNDENQIQSTADVASLQREGPAQHDEEVRPSRTSNPVSMPLSPPNNAEDHLEDVGSPQCEIMLILDSMERVRRTTSDTTSMRDLLQSEGIHCQVRQLPVGDALFVAQYPDGSEIVLDYLIERKTLHDYLSSLKDGRVERQSYMMLQSNTPRRVFVLEGDMRNYPEITEDARVRKRLTELEVWGEFYVKRTKDLTETTWFYTSLFRRLRKEFQCQRKARVERGRQGFPAWKTEMGNLKTGLRLEQLFFWQLCQMKGVSKKTAGAVQRMGYSTPWRLFERLVGVHGIEEREKMLTSGDERITTAASRMICQVFCEEDYGTELVREGAE